MSGEDELKMFRIKDGVEGRKDGTTRIADCSTSVDRNLLEDIRTCRTNMFDTLPQHHLMENLAATQTHKSMTIV